MKYIIEIEDTPFESEGSETELYKATEFNSLVFDKIGLDKLTPYVPAVDFESGCETGWMFARAISNMGDDDIEEAFQIFDWTRPIEGVLNKYSYYEASETYNAWKVKADAKQKVVDLANEIGIHKLYAATREIRGE